MSSISRDLLLGTALILGACGNGNDDTGADRGACEAGMLCTWFGTPRVAGLAEDGTHRLDAATFWVVDVAFRPGDDQPIIMDWNNHRVLTLDDEDRVVTVSGVGGHLGDGPEGDALEAEWNHPTDVDWLSDGSLIMAAWHNSRVVRFTPDYSEMEFIAGTGGRDYSGDGGPAVDAVLDLPCAVRVDEADNIYIGDMANQRIRRISPDGIIDTVAGTGEHGYNGDGDALETMLASPALQRAEPASKFTYWDGSIWLADTHNGRIREFDIAASTITTVGGMGETPPNSDNGTTCESGCGYSGDGGDALEAMLDTPSDVAMASDGTLYFADTDNSCVRMITPDGIIETFAGTCGERGFEGEGVLPTDAVMDRPFGVAVDSEDNVYISDTYNSVIRWVPAG